ncbi:MAG: aspartyl protease family protein [Rhodospirillaceae bacterium]
MNLRYAVVTVSFLFSSVAPFGAAAAGDTCQPDVLHSLPLVAFRDGRAGLPVTFGEKQGALVLDTTAVAQGGDAARKSVPVTGGLETMTAVRSNYTGIAGTLTQKTVDELGLSPTETGARYGGAGGGRRELKVLVPDFAIQGQSPSSTEFLISTGDSRLSEYAGTFAINNFRQFDFDFDLDFPGRGARLIARGKCAGAPADWSASPVARVSFSLDGNGYLEIPITLDGKEFAALLDTGSPSTTLDFGSASRTFRIKDTDADLKAVTQTAEGRTVYSRPFTSIAFGDVAVAGPQILLVPGFRGKSEGAPTGSRVDRDRRGALPPVIVGMSVLRQLRLYFAFDERVIYIARSDAAAK